MKNRLMTMLLPVGFIIGVPTLFYMFGNMIHLAVGVLFALVTLFVSFFLVACTGEYLKWVIIGKHPTSDCQNWFAALAEIYEERDQANNKKSLS